MAHLDITPWEPEETVGKIWHRLAARMDPPQRFADQAADRFDDDAWPDRGPVSRSRRRP
ncbi:hypothetical protein [Paracoccus sp. DMF-8]|uniref:hypothetical protein n=1 Tax=Paracoccus sp. DMF-8 TaxID=3019445 RepID=UPI003204F687